MKVGNLFLCMAFLGNIMNGFCLEGGGELSSRSSSTGSLSKYYEDISPEKSQENIFNPIVLDEEVLQKDENPPETKRRQKFQNLVEKHSKKLEDMRNPKLSKFERDKAKKAAEDLHRQMESQFPDWVAEALQSKRR